MGDISTTLKSWFGGLGYVSEWWTCPHAFTREAVRIPDDCFGINVATAADAACDDYVLSCLEELGIRTVRLTLGPESLASHGLRFVDRLIEAKLDVMLCLVPTAADAERLLTDNAVSERWREFVQTVWDRYQGRLASIEIGSTPNRRRWSGFNYERYRRAWQIACEVCQDGETLLAGPNVSDFEPFHNVGLLEMMGTQPADIHTDNLFVERVVEPEAFDHRVAGRALTHVLKLNLVKKAWILRKLSTRFGCSRTYCTYTCWDAGRVQRLHARSAEKQADYLVRYLTIAASSGALERIYWGPLIGCRDGLIDDGTGVYPPDERVSRYEDVTWDPAGYTKEPGYRALGHLVSRLSGAALIRGCVGANGISQFDFKCPTGAYMRIAWARDRQVALLENLYSTALFDGAELYDCEGRKVEHKLEVLTERPLYLIVKDPALLREDKALESHSFDLFGSRRLVAACLSLHDCVPFAHAGWRGAAMVKHGASVTDIAKRLAPESIEKAADRDVLRDGRNLVWASTLADVGPVVVKKIRIAGIKQLTYRFRASKARRQWNHASEMCRRGIPTPTPIAFMESTLNPGVSDSYYVCEHIEDAWSARDVFRAFRDGQGEFKGRSREDLFDAIAGFLRKMHRLKMYHRDMSAGNLLMRDGDKGELEFFLIDVGRSRVLFRRLHCRERLADLVRLCHPLDPFNREALQSHYARHTGTACTGMWKMCSELYDWKQSLKRLLRGRG